MTRRLSSLFSILTIMPFAGIAANLTNHIAGVGPQGTIRPYFCIQDASQKVTLALAPDQSGDGNLASGNPNYIGGALRFNGCASNNSYLGYLNLLVSATGPNRIDNYQPPVGVHVGYTAPAIDSKGQLTGAIAFTPIEINSSLIKAKPDAMHWQYAGVNLSGAEFGKVVDPVVIPNLSQQDASTPYSDLADTTAFIQAGMNTIRVPVSWDYLQMNGAGVGKLSQEYYDNFIRPLLATLTQAHVYTIIDLHAYMRYSTYGKQYSGCNDAVQACPDGTLVLDSQAYQSVWGQLLELIQQDTNIDMNYIMLDLMNEPVDVPNDSVFTIQTDLIKYLRGKAFNGPILVEGNAWSGLHSWSTKTWTGTNGETYTNASLFTRENFNKVGITDLSNIIINVHQYLDTNYSGVASNCLQDLSTTGPDGFNLDAFINYLNTNQFKAMVTEFGAGSDASSCTQPLTQFVQYLQDHSATGKSYGFVGWTAWSTGHGWGGYPLRITPTSYQMKVLSAYIQD